MNRKVIIRSCTALFGLLLLVANAGPATGQSAPAQATSPALARRIGAVKAVSGTTVTLGADSGPDITVNVQPNARILRIAPGAKDLTSATPIQLQDLQTGDRVRVRGKVSADGNSIDALEIIAIARTDLEARNQQDQQDWQKRGVGGLVSKVDAGTGVVTVSVTTFSGKKEIAVHSSKDTVIRRYAPDSVKFDDAKPGTLNEIRVGDQLRARGDRSSDGSELNAQEIVSGSFRNIAGTVNSTDANAGTVTVQDLLSKKAVTVKVASDSQLHKLPPEAAQRIAMRLKGMTGSAGAGQGPAAASAPAGSPPANGQHPSAVMGGGANGAMGGMHQGGAPDLSQMLSRMPTVTVPDLHKGDAVLIVATEGGTAITLLSGVEPLLQASPAGSQAMMLTPWSLGGAPGGEAMQ